MIQDNHTVINITGQKNSLYWQSSQNVKKLDIYESFG